MTVRGQVLFWLGLVAVLALTLFVFRDILLPFVVGMAVAYVADPIADRFEAWGMSRGFATSAVTAIFFTLFILVALLILPVVAGQVANLADRLPDYLERLFALVEPLRSRAIAALPFDAGIGQGSDLTLQSYVQKGLDWLAGMGGRLWSGGLALINFASLLVITPIVAFYLLNDWDRIVARIDGWLPRDHAAEIRRIMADIDDVLAGFIRGQGAVCLVLGLYYALALSLVGLDFGFVIGLVSGILTFIPYVGAIFGAVASIGVALVQFWPDYPWIGGVALIYAVGQVVEGNFLTPRLVGRWVGLHPVWVVFGLLAGGVLFGFVGLLLALPVTAIIGVLVRYGLARYLASQFYLGRPGGGEP